MSKLSPGEFAAKWSGSQRHERAAAQEHFVDLCRMLDMQTPNDADPKGEWYAFEKGASKSSGGDGWDDGWKLGHFAWEYKGKLKELVAAYKQLLDYREALESPPLLVVCDLDRFEVHTNFTGTVKVVHRFSLADLAVDPREAMRVLRALMASPNDLRPKIDRRELTEKATAQFAALARRLREPGHTPLQVAHFLNRLVFCMFAEDAGLLPSKLIVRLAENTRLKPVEFSKGLSDLFMKMSKGGGLFGTERVQWFNGGLFNGGESLALTTTDIDLIRSVADMDWSQIEPAIFGTLFERSLDPGKRSQLGAHYTDRESILKLVEPVLMTPLRREFDAVKQRVTELVAAGKRVTARTPAASNPHKVLEAFLDRVDSVVVLDPACGSGNFLYVALQCVKDFEREVINWSAGAPLKRARSLPRVGPHQLRGIEFNVFAAEVARVTIWIGEIQWMIANGFDYRSNPVLQPLDNIRCGDAILDESAPTGVCEPDWPEADVIVGNPPFLGGKLLRTVLGDAYVDKLFELYHGRVPAEADLVTYWFEKARAALEKKRVQRVGLLATQGIRGGANREVLERIKKSGDIFLAWSDEPWVLDGAAVHVSFVGFDRGEEQQRTLNGQQTDTIHANLTGGVNVTRARRLKENLGIAFMGDTKGGPFNISADVALPMLDAPNPHGRSNREVVRPWANGKDLNQGPRGRWIIDFGVDMPESDAAMYMLPFEYVKTHVWPVRKNNKRYVYAKRWWLHVEPRLRMRRALAGKARFISTTRHAKHRIFAWLQVETVPDSALIAFARDDDYTFGVLHSRLHEVWALSQGTQLETRPRYTPTSTFETFPFPEPSKKQREAIATAARELNQQRERVLNPPGATAAELAKCTLTNLYNNRPTWLANAHAKLDAAVFAAYGWPANIDDDDLLGRLLALNLEREAAPEADSVHEGPDDSSDDDSDDGE